VAVEKRNVRDKLALAWVAAAKAPKSEGGLGLTLEEAIGLLEDDTVAESFFGIKAETIRRYWNTRPNQRRRDFTLSD
jgi:hypothetical protein